MMNKNSNKYEKIVKLLPQYSKGNRQEMEMLYTFLTKECIQLAKNYLYKKSITSIQAKDVAQNVCLKLHIGTLEKYNAEAGRFDAWLKKIVINEVYDIIRASRSKYISYYENDSTCLIEATEVLITKSVDSDTYTQNNELKSHLNIAMNLLSKQDYMIWNEVQIKGERVKNVAVTLGQNANWVSGRIAQSRKKMSTYLGKLYKDGIQDERNVSEIYLSFKNDKTGVAEKENIFYFTQFNMAA
jgi:RNA polymerase sigma factor (sigma-70 family)